MMVVNNTNTKTKTNTNTNINTNTSGSSNEEADVDDDPPINSPSILVTDPPQPRPSAAAASASSASAHDFQLPQQQHFNTHSHTHTHTHHVYDVVIVGAGLAGLATAVGLYERGITNIIVIEKATQFQKVGASIALFQNGIRALEYISPSISQRIKQSCIPITKLLVKDGISGNVVEEKEMKQNTDGSNVVHYMVWYLLQQYLRDGLPSHIIQLNQKVNSFEINTMNHDHDNGHDSGHGHGHGHCPGNVTIHIEDGSSIHSKVLIGCDGINSMIRNHLFGMNNSNSSSNNNNGAVPRKIYHGKVSYRCVFPIESLFIGNKNKKETHTKNDTNNSEDNRSDNTGNDDDGAIENNNNNNNNSKYCIKIPPEGVNTTYQNHEKGKSFSFRITAPGIMTVTSMSPIQDPTLDYNLNYVSSASDTETTSACNKKKKQQRLKEVFQNFTAPEIQSIIHHICSGNGNGSSSSSLDVRIDPIYDLDVVDEKYGGWSRGGPVLCIGDAVHAMSPSLGQGANQSFEDACIVVSKLSPVLLEFQQTRKHRRRQQQLCVVQHTLTEVWKSRIDRVKKIHSASRRRSFANNHTHTNSTSTTTTTNNNNTTTDGTNKRKTIIDLTSNELQQLLLEINNWYPLSSSSSSSTLPTIQG